MRKIFTFLCAALMSVGMFAATVTWNSSTFSSIDLHDGQLFTKDGVTLTALEGLIDGEYGDWMGGSSNASFKFSTSLGNFTKIEITGNIIDLGGSGWTQTSPGAVWAGDANETTFGTYFQNVSQIVFTIAEPTVAVTGVTLNQSEAQMTVGGETLTLTATVNPNNATDQSVSWSTSDANVATVENGVVTAVAAGNATITVTTTDGSFTATCAVTVTAPEPQGERELTKLGFNFPSENIPADNDIEMAGTFEEGTMWMEKIIATGWFVSYDFVNAAEDETFKLRSKSNNDLVLCQFIPANDGEGGKWVQAIFTFGNYWDDDTWHGTPCKLIEKDLSDAAQYAWMEGMPEPQPTGIENIVLTEKAKKVIVDGMIYIVRDGKLFNLTGAEVK